jgi:outer membrane protein assembly factor BamB
MQDESKNKVIGITMAALLAAGVLIVVLFFLQGERTDREHVGTPQGEIKEKWVFETGGTVRGSPALDSEGALYVGSDNGYLYAIDSSGALQWKFQTGSIETSPTLGPDEAIYVTNARGKLYAINHTGTKRWETELSGGRSNYNLSGNAIDGDFIYTFCVSALCSIEAENGSPRWSLNYASAQFSAPAILASGMIATNGRNRLKVVARDGTLQWVYPPVTPEAVNSNGGFEPPGTLYVVTPLAVGADDTIYAGTSTGSMIAVGMGGQFKWQFKVSAAVEAGAPVIGSDGTIYFGSRDGRLYAVNPDGSKKWDLNTITGITTAPVLAADGTIFVISGNSVLAASGEGKKKWSFVFNDAMRASPTLAPDGTLYVATGSGKIYAFPGSAGGLMASPWPKYQRDLANSGRAPSLHAGLP